MMYTLNIFGQLYLSKAKILKTILGSIHFCPSLPPLPWWESTPICTGLSQLPPKWPPYVPLFCFSPVYCSHYSLKGCFSKWSFDDKEHTLLMHKSISIHLSTRTLNSTFRT